MSTLIKDIVLLPLDGREAIEHAVLHIDGQTILYAGEAATAPLFAPEKTIAGRGRLAMPGLVNAHTHTAMTLLRGVGSDLPLDQWLFGEIIPAEDRLVEGDTYWGSMLAIMEMLRFGTTSFLDMYMLMGETAKAVEKTGIRAVLSRGITGTTKDDLYRIKESETLYKDWHGSCQGRLQVMLAPHAEYTTNPFMLKSIIAKADELGCGINVHVSETCKETKGCIERHGMTPVAYLDSLGMFDRHTVAAHCVAINQEDAAILAAKGVFVAHNPISNLKLGSGIMPLYPSLLPRTALGSDGAASNNTLSIMEEIRFAALLHKGCMQDPLAMPVDEVLAMATVRGAKALRQEQVGTLSHGMKADIILLDTDVAHAVPHHHWASHVAYAAQGSDVSLTMVDGSVLYEDGQFATLDPTEVMAQVKTRAKRLVGA